jgi:2'-5' RNA ligase
VSRSVLLVPFPEVAAATEPWLERLVGARPSHGMPPHVTLLFPFPPAAAPVIAETEQALARFDAFDVRFCEFGRFHDSDTLYLAPEPAAPFVAMTEALVARFPEWPPYGGAYDSVAPHLTVASGTCLDEAGRDLETRLPLHGRAREAVLLTEVAPERWVARASFPLEGG